MEHGTVNGYSNRKCRCPECREAWRVWRIEYRRRRGIPVKPPRGTNVTHGRIGTYNSGCRCDDCREAARLKQARVRKRKLEQPTKNTIAFGPFTLEARNGKVSLQ